MGDLICLTISDVNFFDIGTTTSSAKFVYPVISLSNRISNHVLVLTMTTNYLFKKIIHFGTAMS